MLRVPLKQSDAIRLNNQNYTIDTVIGDGANCIVYSAYYTDNVGHKHRVNIKECYPYCASIKREGFKLIWEAEDEQQTALLSFRTAYEKLMTWQNESFAVSVFDLCEENNTLYIIMNADNGITFDKEKTASLHDILKTVKLLAHFVGRYHENGYLHLDIKPSNFLVYPRPSEHIILFDMDSVTSISDIKEGYIRSISYSDGWAAPEQKQGKIGKLCPATDIYSIGAILFEKILGRAVTAFDTGIFSDWNFEGELFDNVNPAIKRYLKDIFRKTLAASIKRRYQTTDHLIKILDQACKITLEGKPYLKSSFKGNAIDFIGRDEERKQIHQAFESGKRAVFLHGEGGIGKSTLAVSYGEKFEKEYDAILFLRYRDSLEELLHEINSHIHNFDEEDHSFKQLHRLLSPHILLIIDNFDIEIDQDEYLDEFLKLNAHLLFTSRTDFSSVCGGIVSQIEVCSLPYEQLMRLFSRKSGQQIRNDNEKVLFDRLLKKVDYNTYVVELLGCQIAASEYSLEELWESVSKGLVQLTEAEKIRVQKDGKNYKRTVPDIMRVLFRIADLSEARKQALRNLYMLRFLEVDRDTYFSMTYERNLDVLNDLAELGWVKHDAFNYWLHPLMEAMVQLEMPPNSANCYVIFHRINWIIDECVKYDGYGMADEIKHEDNCQFLCAFFLHADFGNREIRKMAIGWLFDMISNDYAGIGDLCNWWFRALYEKMLRAVLEYKLSSSDELKIRCIYFVAWAAEYGHLWLNADDRKNHEETREKELRASLNDMLRTAEKVSRDEFESDTISEVVGAISTYLSNISLYDIPQDCIRVVYDLDPESFGMEYYKREQYGLPLTDTEQAELDEYRASQTSNHEYTDEDRIEDESRECAKRFWASENKSEFAESIVNDKSIPYVERMERIESCIRDIYFRTAMGIEMDVDSYDWNMLKEVLEIEDEFLFSDEHNLLDYEGLYSWSEHVGSNIVHRLITYAVLNDSDEVDYCFTSIFNAIKREVERMIKREGHVLNRILMEFSFERPFGSAVNDLKFAVNSLMSVHRASYALPHLIQYAAGWRDFAGDDSEDLIPLYKTIVDCSIYALREDDVSEKSALELRGIREDYQKRIQQITDTSNYRIKPPEDDSL